MSSKPNSRILLADEKYGCPSEPFRVFPKSPDDEIVISGMSGRFPKSDNIQEFRDHLYNKVGCTNGDTQWFVLRCSYKSKLSNVERITQLIG